jgi:hypothetical protein
MYTRSAERGSASLKAPPNPYSSSRTSIPVGSSCRTTKIRNWRRRNVGGEFSDEFSIETAPVRAFELARH